MATNGKKVPVVLVAPEVHERVENYVRMATGEVSWVGVVRLERDEGRLVALVDDITFLKQWCTGSLTHIDPVVLDEWMREKGWTGPETPMNLYWGHSHVNMGVFWSGTDEDCVTSFLNFTGSGVLASVVYNKKGEWKARLDVSVGVAGEEEAWTQDAEMVVNEVEYGTTERCEKEVRELVTSGTAPSRDLRDDRLAALEKEDKEKGKGMVVYGGRGWNGYHQGYGGMYGGGVLDTEDERWEREWSGYGSVRKSGGFVKCDDCPDQKRCAGPVINVHRVGCQDRRGWTSVGMLEGEHWKEAKSKGRTKELQSWRDREKEREAKEEGGMIYEVKKICTVGDCVKVLNKSDGYWWELGKCQECVGKSTVMTFPGGVS